MRHVAYLNGGRLEFAEQMTALSNRFRDVEITMDSAVTMPAETPNTWLNAEQSPTLAREVTVSPMPLRAIALALAKSAKYAPEVTRCI